MACRIAAHRELGIAGAAVDVGPGRGMDDDLGPVAIQPGADPVRVVEVEVATVPGDRPGGPGERRVGEAGHEGSAQSSGGTRHGHPHQSGAVPVARRRPYWRS